MKHPTKNYNVFSEKNPPDNVLFGVHFWHAACDMLRRVYVALATKTESKSVHILAERFLHYRTQFLIM